VKSKAIIVCLLAFSAVALIASVPNNEQVLNTGKRVTTLPGFVYRVTYTYYTLIDGRAYNSSETPSSDYFLVLGDRAMAFGFAGNEGNASSFFVSEGFQWSTGPTYFADHFAAALPDRWDGM
jgi:hypothetical protein